MISDIFHSTVQELTQRQKQQDFDDLQHEVAGLSDNVGRNSRFRNKEHANGEAVQRRRSQAQINMTALDILLQRSPEYAKLYNDTTNLLNRAERATELALEQAPHDLSQAKDELQETLESANKLHDGTAIFKDANGQVWTEDGRLVEQDELQGVVWKENAPSHEDYQRRKKAVGEHRQRIDDLRHYQIDVLGNARDKLYDKQNPLSPDELQKVHDDILTKADSYVAQKTQPETDGITAENNIDISMETPKIDAF